MVSVGIIGASGYTGGDLLRILSSHREVEIEYITSRKYVGKHLHSLFPNFRKVIDKKFEAFEQETANQCDVLFLCVPHTVSMELLPQLIENRKSTKIVDLSADFRLDSAEVYEKYYVKHTMPEMIKERVVGLPEFHREEIKKANFVSCYGCISTNTILGLAPVIKSKLIDFEDIIVEAKVGSSATGRSFSLATHHPERTGVVRPYKLTGHRHSAEVVQELSSIGGKDVKIGFSAVSTNHVRGILTVTHVKPNSEVKDKDLWKAYRAIYQEEPFVRILKAKNDIFKLPDPKFVVASNFCDVGWEIDQYNNRIVLVSALDNLVKGSGGQATQCMNLMFGIEETEGLKIPGPYP
ncbi:MAG: N-acetyl-gamma-glutamyl-phosphate reductase [Candidatus Ranarchaeia archaeon]